MSTAGEIGWVGQDAMDIIFARKLMPVILDDDTKNPFGNDAPIFGAAGSTMFVSIMPPGQGPCLHSHNTTFETFMVLQGEIEYYVGEPVEHRARLGKWDTFSCPPGVYRGFHNVGDVDAVQLTVITGLGEDRDDVSMPDSIAQPDRGTPTATGCSRRSRACSTSIPRRPGHDRRPLDSRPPQLLYRSQRAAARRAAPDARAGHLRRRHRVLPRMVHAAFVRSPHAHARIVSIDTAAAGAAPGVVAVVTGEDLARIHDPWVGVLTHLEGLKSAPQHALPVEIARWAGRGGGRRRRRAARAGRGRRRAGRDRVGGAPRRDRHGDRARSRETPVIHAELGDNLAWQRQYAAGDVDAAYAGRRRGGRGDLSLRPPYRGDAGAARAGRRFRPVDPQPDGPPLDPVAAHDAGHLRAPFRARGAPRAGGGEGRRRLVRDQGPHLCRRDGDGGALDRRSSGR